MAILILQLLFASVAVAHFGVESIIADGTTYPPFNSRIDHLLGNVRRIEWSHDIVVTTFNPITNFSDPALACRVNPRPPLLKAPVRAGAEIKLNWSPITRMHQGPIITYMGYLPTPNTPPTEVKFFKIYEKGFDAAKDKWANEIAADDNDSFQLQIPSDIKAGTYVLRTEMIALHGNMKNLNQTSLAGPQFYNYCFNLDVIGNGMATPDGVKFPGAYKPTDYGLTFQPFMTYDSEVGGTAQNSKYATPGPPKYNGKYDKPTGNPPVVTETGTYPPALEAKYEEMWKRIEAPGEVLSTFVNRVWHHYKSDKEEFKKYGAMVAKSSKESKAIVKSLQPDIEAFRKATGQ